MCKFGEEGLACDSSIAFSRLNEEERDNCPPSSILADADLVRIGDDLPAFDFVGDPVGISDVSTPIEEKVLPSRLLDGDLMDDRKGDPTLEAGESVDEVGESCAFSIADRLGAHISRSFSALDVLMAFNP